MVRFIVLTNLYSYVCFLFECTTLCVCVGENFPACFLLFYFNSSLHFFAVFYLVSHCYTSSLPKPPHYLAFKLHSMTHTQARDQFAKSYSYSFRHMYGKEGSRKNYTPFSCMKIIMGSPPEAGAYHGCPFRSILTLLSLPSSIQFYLIEIPLLPYFAYQYKTVNNSY